MAKKTGRPIKYNSERESRFLEALRSGATRQACCASINISDETLRHWLVRYPTFLEKVEDAEHHAELRFSLIIAQAAQPHDVIRVKKTEKPVMLEDGSVKMIVETVTETSRENDWRAALEWLKRRKRRAWGDSLHVDLDREIQDLMEKLQGHTGKKSDE